MNWPQIRRLRGAHNYPTHTASWNHFRLTHWLSTALDRPDCQDTFKQIEIHCAVQLTRFCTLCSIFSWCCRLVSSESSSCEFPAPVFTSLPCIDKLMMWLRWSKQELPCWMQSQHESAFMAQWVTKALACWQVQTTMITWCRWISSWLRLYWYRWRTAGWTCQHVKCCNSKQAG